MSMYRFCKFVAVFVLVFLAQINIGYAAENGKQIIEKWIAISSGSSFLTVKRGEIDFNENANIVTLKNFAISFNLSSNMFSPGDKDKQADRAIIYTIGFPELKIVGLSESQNRYKLDSMVAELTTIDTEVDFSNQKVKSTASYSDWSVTDMSFAIPPNLKQDARHPASRFYPLVKTMAEMDFSEMKIGKVTIVQNDEKLKTTISIDYGKMVASNSVKGNIERLTMSGFIVTSLPTVGQKDDDSTADDFAFKLTSGPLTIDQYNTGTLIRSFAPENIGNDQSPYKTVLGKMKLDGIKGEFKGGSFSIDAILISDWGVRATKKAFLPVLDELILMFQETKNPEPKPEMLVDVVTTSYGAMRLGKQVITGMKFKTDNGAQGGLKSFSIEDFSSAGIGGLAFSGLYYDIPKEKAKGKIDEYRIKNLRFPSMLALLRFDEARKSKDIVAMLKAIPSVEEITANGVEYTFQDKGPLKWVSSVVRMQNHIGPIPTKIDIVLKGASMPVSDIGGQEAKDLKKLGYETLNLSYDIQLAWDEASKKLGLKTIVDLKDGGRIETGVMLGNLPRLAFENPYALVGLATAMTFERSIGRFEDESIIERLIKFYAAENNIQPEAMRQQLIGSVPFALESLKNPAFTKSVTEAVRSLLEGKKTLTIKAAPKEPTPLIGLVGPAQSNPGSLIDILGVEVEAK